MDWAKYFAGHRGHGLFATSDRTGKVNVAVFARPHVLPDGSFAWGMADRLTHRNLTENPFAAFAFDEGGWQGHRFYLEKIGEEEEGALVETIRANAENVVGVGVAGAVRRVVRFRVLQVLPLVGV